MAASPQRDSPKNATAFRGLLSHRLQATKSQQLNQEDSMATLLLLGLFDNPGTGQWIFLSVGAVCLFGVFLPTAIFMENQRKEKDAFYKAETLRRLTETSGEGAKAVLDHLRQEERMKQIKTREGMKIGGVINLGVGIGLIIFLRALIGGEPIYLCGLIPGLIGAAMLAYVFFLAAPLE
jgi:hypothetical protein